MKTFTIDITPTWQGLLMSLLDLMQSKKSDVRRDALTELQRMAKAADLWNEHVKSLAKSSEGHSVPKNEGKGE